MKQLQHLSPSSINCWKSDPTAFYLRYLSDNRPPRDLQTEPMSVGSGFDSYIKAYLRHALFGDDQEAIFEKYFTDSVEPHNRDFALVAGKRVFDNYIYSGAAADLIVDMMHATEGPKFEFYVTDKDESSKRDNEDGVKFLGKPDAWYVNKEGQHVILDWKVNGYCSKHPVSPKKGYVMIRDGKVDKPTRGTNAPHKEAILLTIKGVLIDSYYAMEEKDIDWAVQLSIYAWLCGEKVGSDLIGAIDQIVINNQKGGEIRVAEHRCRIGTPFQFALYEECKEIWDVCHSDHVFRHLTKEESAQRCKALDQVADVYNDPLVKAMYGRE